MGDPTPEAYEAAALGWDESALPPGRTGRVSAEGPRRCRRIVDRVWPVAVANTRHEAAAAVLAKAFELQAESAADPDLYADAAILGEIEGLWSAARIVHEPTWRAAYEKRRSQS